MHSVRTEDITLEFGIVYLSFDVKINEDTDLKQLM